jgi:hypothetical protein
VLLAVGGFARPMSIMAITFLLLPQSFGYQRFGYQNCFG